MAKVITSPSKRWPGTVTLYDPLTLPQVEAIEIYLANTDTKDGEKPLRSYDREQLPALIACVEEWNIENFPVKPTLETWPLSPRRASREFVMWLLVEILAVYNGELAVPNELSPTLTDTQAKDDTPQKSESSKELTASA